MPKINIDDTIAAIATPIGEGGIGIIRLSGKEALLIADRIFLSKDGNRPSGYRTYTTHYGKIVNSNQEVVDEVILTVMRAPKSYTKEDIVEINCHGGIVPLKKALELVLANGARLAEPGEFTKRAFLNGRIDLVQAEAVLDIIKAKTQKGLEIALSQLGGGLSNSVHGLKTRLVDVKVHLEASIDFPEEGLDTDSLAGIKTALNSIKADLENFINASDAGKIIREGITCVICGKPNAGKSSLMNALLKEERVIVTPLPGTTRDAVSEYINVDGIPLNIVDTAGIIKTEDVVEKEGIIRSKLYIDRADLVLFMMDAGAGLSCEDREIIELIRHKEVIAVLNKTDLDDRKDIDLGELEGYFGRKTPVCEISALKNINLAGLLKNIAESVWRGKVFANDYNIMVNARHKDSLVKTLGFVNEAISSLDSAQPEDIISISINEAISSLGQITGEEIGEELLDKIFGQFCVGK